MTFDNTTILAAVEDLPDALMDLPKSTSLYFSDAVLVILLGLLLLGVLLFWAAFVRKPTKRRVRKNKGGRKVFRERAEKQAAGEADQGRRRFKYRSRRREHRGRNPTLSETGGLPPPREEAP